MKKGLKITGIVVGSLLLILLLLPIAFKGKIKDIVVSQGNKMLNAQFDMDALNISLIRNFPNATITIKDLELWGVEDFAQDTLLSADRISATVNLSSIFSNKGIEVKRVLLSGVDVKAIVLEDGRPNWDIMKPSDKVEEEAEETDDESTIGLRLDRVTFDDIDVIYDDRESGDYAQIDDFSLTLRGNLSADHTTLKIETLIEKLLYRSGATTLVNNVALAANINVDADLENKKFVLEKNSLSINAIKVSLDGSLAMLDDEAMEVDLTMNTDKVGFKEILSLVPAIYAKDFASLKADGNVAMTAWVKGLLKGELLPAFDLSLEVSDGSFQYPALPKGVTAINLKASAKNPGGVADQTVIDVSPFSLNLAGNPFAANLHLTSPISDPAFKIKANGTVDLGAVKDVYPMDDMELNGVFTANLDLQGRMSYIEKEQYTKFLASGTLGIQNLLLKMEDMPDVDVKKSTFTFTPQYLNLSETTVNIGSSDITLDSRFENYMAFLSKGQVVKGNLNVRSNNLDLNELMGGDPAEEQDEQESSPMEVFRVPENINFRMNTTLNKVLFDNLVLDNVVGVVTIDKGKLDMSNLSFNTLGGAVVANGYYSTANDPNSPELNAAFGLKEVSFSQTFNTFVAIQKMAPIFENLKGNFSGGVKINTRLDSEMSPIFETLNGGGAIHTKDLNLSGVPVLDKIADATNYSQLKDINVKDLNVDFEIIKGRVHTEPFDIKMGNMNLNLTGSTGIDQTIDYTGKLALPPSSGIAKYTTIDLKIGGTFDSPKVSLDAKGMAEQAVKSAASEALDKVGEKLGIDISDVEARRQTLIDQAEKNGEKLIEEAKKQAKNLEDKAEGRLAKAAAKVAGDKLIEEAEKTAEGLVKKATEQGDKMVEKAKAGETE